MADNFDTLAIKITASAADAIKKVNALADALDRVNRALSGIDSSGLSAVSADMERMSNAIQSFRGNTRTLNNVANAVAQMGQSAGAVAQTATVTEGMAQAANTASRAVANAGTVATRDGAGGFQRFSNVLNSVAQTAVRGGTALGRAFLGLGEKISNATAKLKDFSKHSSKSTLSASALAKELTRIGKMLKLMVTRMILRKIITGVADGFKNLAQYSAQFDASVSLLWNSFRQLGNAIAAAVSPLLNAFAPALNTIIQYAIEAVNAINQLISAMLGLGTWTRAKTLTDDYAKSLDKSSKKAKELKNTVLKFDELNQLQEKKDNGNGMTNPADMFEEVAVDKKWKEIADKLLDPIKKAWDKVGDYVKDSWKKALNNLKKLGSDIARDFWEVWAQPETVELFEHILNVVGNIGQFVGNLANSFDKAWNKAGVGKRILEDIRDICLIISKHLDNITASWAKWADEVDFTPALEGIEGWLDSLKKPIDELSGVFEDFNEDFLQPLATWSLEKGLPDLLKVFQDFNEKVDWELLRERLDKIWKALEPFAEKVGEGLIQFIGDVSDKLADFINSDEFGNFVDMLVDWMNNVDADEIADGLKVIAAALLAYKGLSFLNNFSATGGIVLFLTELSLVVRQAKKDLEEWDSFIDSKGGLLNALLNRNEYARTKESNPYTNGEVASWTKILGAALQWVQDKLGATTQNAIITLLYFSAKVGQIIKDIVSSIPEEIKKMKANIELKIGELQTKIKEKIAEIKSDVKSIIDDIKKFFNKDNWTFSGVAEGLRETFRSAKNAIKDIWNPIVENLNGSHTIGFKTVNINLPKIYASGGFPEDGLFMANHNELVGKFSNGKTAVANNEQITDGIARAVYSAITAANGGGGNNTRYINNTIQIDGKTIARAVTVGQDKLNRLYSPTMA